MRLTYDSIGKVVELTSDGVPYCWIVCSKRGWVSDIREYINYNEKGRTMIAPYPVEWFPKTVQKFIANHRCVLKPSAVGLEEPDDFARYEYK